MPKPIYIEGQNGLIYEVIDCPDYPLDDDGEPCLAVAVEEDRRIEIAGFIRGAERPRLLAEALGVDFNSIAWRLTVDTLRVMADVSCLVLGLVLVA